MPVYDYQCKSCNHVFDAFKKVDNRNVPCSEPCPQCGVTGHVEQLIGAPKFVYSAAKIPTNVKLQEKFQQIHENTYGSTLDTTSTITKI